MARRTDLDRIAGLPLSESFYNRPTDDVAYDLVGKILVHEVGEKTYVGRITETEAYLGLLDPACHSYHGKRTPRSELLYQGPGRSYVYLIYGMYHCLNFITLDEDTPEAVLIRAVEPLSEIEAMQVNRKTEKTTMLTTGPGRLCQAFDIDISHNRLLPWDSSLKVLSPQTRQSVKVASSHRIGIDSAGDAALWPLRFYQADSPFVSKTKSHY